jgi:hypothetical protein
MIIGTLEKRERYAALGDGIRKAFEWLANNDIRQMKDGKYAVDGDKLFVLVQRYTTRNMDDRGKVINIAFSVSAAFVFGDHLGYVARIDKGMLSAVIVGKLAGGISAVVIAYFWTLPRTSALMRKNKR